MTRSSRFAAVALALVLFGLLAAPLVSAVPPPNAGPPPHAGPNIEVQILALNDFHGQMRPADPTLTSGNRVGAIPAGGSEALADYVRALRATNPNTLFVSAGDLIGATPLISGIFHDEPTIEAMNLMGLDYNGVGNHEFDEGIPELLRMQNGGCHPDDGCFPTEDDGFDGANFPFLAANVTYKEGGETIFPPYAVHEYKHANIKVAIVGMTLEGTPSVVTQEAIADVDFHDEADTVNALIPELQAQGIQTIIVLLHEGGSTGQTLTAGNVDTCGTPTGAIVDVVQRMNPEIDLVVTGHTNWALNCPDFAGTGIMVTGAGSIGRIVTDVDLTISKETKDVVSATMDNVIVCNGLPFPVTPVPVFPACPNIKPAANHADVSALIAKYAVVAAPIEDEKIGVANEALTRDTIPPTTSTPVQSGESSLGDIIADAQLWATSTGALPTFEGDPAVIAFMNAGGIRRDINAGDITYGEAFEVQPFANVLTTMDMTGAQILAVLQQQFTGSPLGNGILQISDGLTYTRTSAGADGVAGDLMTDVALDGVPINPASVYRVTVNNFLAGGGDNFTVFAQGINRFVGEIDLEAFRRYIETFTPIDPGPQDRITFVVPI